MILGFQNAAMMGNDATRADIFANLGVRVVQLTYNLANQIGDGSMVPDNRGLSAFGREVVARLNANKLMVDFRIAVSGPAWRQHALQASQSPSIIRVAAR